MNMLFLQQISCKCLGGSDAHATTIGLFNTLSSYTWDAKVVIALAAFAVNYGKFWLVVQLSPTNLLADSVALLKQLPVILEQADPLEPPVILEQADPLEPPDILEQADPLEALTNLIKAMLDMTKCIVKFKELPSLYITPETPALATATAHIPTAVYWTIRSIVACASQIMSLIDMGHESIESTTEAWELSSLADTVSNIHSHLKEQLALCYQHIDEKRDAEAYQTLVRIVGMSHVDNIKMLKYLINDKKDQLPLWDGHSNRQVSLDVLRRKNVLLFISEPDLTYDKGLFILRVLYNASRQHPSRPESQYEIVWLPAVDRSAPWIKAMQFERRKASMPWYSVYDPSLLYPPVIKYIKEVWHFNKTPLLVVLDPQGNVVNTNAIHMMWIWGNLAFPFTTAREDGLWREATSLIELLAYLPLISTWISEGKYICLYGGEDIEWIRKFTKTAKAVAQAARIPLEMLYVGKSYPREKVRKNNTTIVAENLSHILPDLNLIWFFWVRLENMWHSKTKHGNACLKIYYF
ncbi:hypothetical protein RHSIM_Rhsim05G0212000 [Rhododendron simsii]|uniref:Sieve element occlusion N-terminal domain-containing protein n=1 Tax=Rhododendron simsii TaxID=118357 RepID=A0A834H2B6_RHOSS|nr:hypothetical protein RHSIM_Rhsim05G0212000 [Rhododendron simsii]